MGCAAEAYAEGFRSSACLDRFVDGNLFVLRRVQAGEFGGIADVLLHLRILLNQDFKDALITANLGMLAFGEELIELGLLFLTVTINTTIALLEGEQ